MAPLFFVLVTQIRKNTVVKLVTNFIKEVNRMIKIEFTNATVEDNGYGLRINGKELEDIISTALGTKVGGKGGYGSGLPSFSSNSCDVTVIINPHPQGVHIEDDECVWDSVEELEEDKENELIKEKDAKTDTEE